MNMMEKIEIPKVEINLSEWQGAGISVKETKIRAMELLGVDNKAWKKLKEEDRTEAMHTVYKNTDKEKPVDFLTYLSTELGVDMRDGLYDAVVTNLKNPSYHKEVLGVPGGVLLNKVYNLKRNNGATNPNSTTQKNGRVKINKDYVVTVTASPISLDIPEPYKFDEDLYLTEIQSHIDKTYQSHYSTNNFQATEFIIDAQHGSGFCMGNILKYAQRYGKKGDDAQARSDLMKIIHYAIIQLHIHDNDYK
tara:strand:+ start:77 stop:823 length:747 start_codon:yes stop_codon:yes gene_type:complete